MDPSAITSLFQSPSFWLACVFITFIAAVIRPLGKVIITGLDSRAHEIKDRIDEAFGIREEAQSFLGLCKKNHDNSAIDAHSYLADTQKGILHMKEQAHNDFLTECARKNKNITQKIALSEHIAIQEVQHKLVSTSIAVSTSIIQENITPKLHNSLIDEAIKVIQSTKNFQ